MSPHTPEPWRAGHFSSIVGLPVTAQPDPMQNSVNVASLHGPNAEANAARIVECVNACKGIVNPASYVREIERYARALSIERDALIAQRDELAAILRRLANEAARPHQPASLDALDDARGLLAKLSKVLP